MVIMEDKKLFLDTNILVYSSLTNSDFQHIARGKILEFATNNYEIWISRQVIREYLSVISKILFTEPDFKIDDVIISVEKFSNQFYIADEIKSTSEILLDLVKKHNITGKNVHDCNIVATMKQYEINNILTHNTKDFIKYSPREINVIGLL